jgi:hypothetical protein
MSAGVVPVRTAAATQRLSRFAAVPVEVIKRFGPLIGSHGLTLLLLLSAEANNDTDIVVFRSADIGAPMGMGKRNVNKTLLQWERNAEIHGKMYQVVALPRGYSQADGWRAYRLLMRRDPAAEKLPPQPVTSGNRSSHLTGNYSSHQTAQASTAVPRHGNQSARTIRNSRLNLDSEAPIPPSPLPNPASQTPGEIRKPGGLAPPPPEAVPCEDSRHARLERWIVFRWEEANAPEKMPWADKQDMRVQLGHSLKGAFADRRVWDEDTLKRCVENRFASDLGPKRREPPARWISRLWEYRDGPLDEYRKLKSIGGERGDTTERRTGERTAGTGALRNNATVARTVSNFHQTAAALQFLANERANAGRSDRGDVSPGEPGERHDRNRPHGGNGTSARGHAGARAGVGVP